MIKANELRIGNLFKEHDSRGIPLETGWFTKNGVSWVSTINHHGVNETSDMGSISVTQFKDMEPIDLTEEWLLKLGFTYTDGEEVYECIWERNLVEFWEHSEGYCHDYARGGTLQYVHQLQNLYFALTGEELSL